jgi:hypothetical protein
VRRRWTTDKALVAAVRAQPILEKMLNAKVTFLEDRIFDAARINISQRVFAPAKKRQGAKPVIEYHASDYQ